MKKFLSAVALSGTAQSQDYARGYDAYEAGDMLLPFRSGDR